ncbi:glutathione S-transferase family protein [Lichenicola sp.]|uniref:glutathione S-transferase family protein n=1 Tax=Lichenicola sp. TaxID=2804529 RepID=UPI003AFFCC55
MKLLYSRASPFARKVRACAVALGIERQIELVEVVAADAPAVLTDANPLGKIPTLITNGNFAIFDSAVICEYLNGTSDVIPIIPPGGAPRWLSLRLEAMGDGLMEAAVLRRQLMLVGGLDAQSVLPELQRLAIARTLDRLEREKLGLHVEIGALSIACALGYLDFRFADENWREGHPRLAEWFAAISKHECLSSTAPDAG